MILDSIYLNKARAGEEGENVHKVWEESHFDDAKSFLMDLENLIYHGKIVEVHKVLDLNRMGQNSEDLSLKIFDEL